MHNKCGLSSIRIKHLKWGKTHRIVSDLSPLIIAPPLILSEELGNGTEFLLLKIHERKRNNLKGTQFSIRYWRISVTLGSDIAQFHKSKTIKASDHEDTLAHLIPPCETALKE